MIHYDTMLSNGQDWNSSLICNSHEQTGLDSLLLSRFLYELAVPEAGGDLGPDSLFTDVFGDPSELI